MTTTPPPVPTDYDFHQGQAVQTLRTAEVADAVPTAQVHATLALAAAVRDLPITLREWTEPIDLVPTEPEPARYVYVASSWRNDYQPYVVAALRDAGLGVYDFKRPDNHGTGFHWSEVGLTRNNDAADVDDYLRALEHPRSIAGYDSDFAAMQRADTFVLVLPCGRSAHLELGWAVGAGKRTAILLEDPCTPELMYRMVDHLASDVDDVVAWATGPVTAADGQVRAW